MASANSIRPRSICILLAPSRHDLRNLSELHKIGLTSQSNSTRCTHMKKDSSATLDELKGWVKEFCEERGWTPFHGPKDLAIGLVTESSELLELFRFVNETESMKQLNESETREKIADELADSLYFILRFAELYKFDLSGALKAKLIKNATKYPALDAKL